MRLVKLKDITVKPNRQRREINADALMELKTSIAAVGLLHPIVVNEVEGQLVLLAGERRVKAIEALWAMGQSLSYAGDQIPEGFIPATRLNDLEPLEAMEVELEENIRRVDITWQEQAEATAQLITLRKLQAEKSGTKIPETFELATSVYPEMTKGAAMETVRQEVILAKHLKDPEVAAAKTKIEGLKIIKRKEQQARDAALGIEVGKTFSAADHNLLKGDCISIMKSMLPQSFDVILTDPPYGINAQNFGDSGGKADAAGHSYDDSLCNWRDLIADFAPLSYLLTKPQAHLYCFCDVDNFVELRDAISDAGWNCFRTPLIWHNPSSQRAPWPQTGPHRRYQMCLYAIKGLRPILKSSSDLVTYASDENLNWAAQKPVDLYADFLSRSCRAGDSVLDPFAGSGTIFPAAHGLKVKATGIEINDVAYGIAVKRLSELK